MTAKEGPVHSAAWSPSSTEFCVIHGSCDDRILELFTLTRTLGSNAR